MPIPMDWLTTKFAIPFLRVALASSLVIVSAVHFPIILLPRGMLFMFSQMPLDLKY